MAASFWLRHDRFGSLRPNPELLDERPPLLRIGLCQPGECLRCLLVRREGLHPEIGEPRQIGWPIALLLRWQLCGEWGKRAYLMERSVFGLPASATQRYRYTSTV